MVEKKTKLTIAIPTYNRNEKLKRIVKILSPQLNEETVIKIYDNCSAIPVSETIADCLQPNIEVIRNKVNVGMSGNFVKCLEFCDTEWLWILGDDDYPLSNCIEIIYDHLTRWPDISFINFNSFMAPSRHEDLVLRGAKQLVESLDHFGNLLCVSLGLYNVNKLYSGLRFAYQYGYTLAPQTAFLLTGLKEGEVLLSTTELINFAANDTEEGGTWSWAALSLVIGALLELPLNFDNKTLKVFSKHLLTHIQKPRPLYTTLTNDNSYTSYERLRLFKMIYDRSTFGYFTSNRIVDFCKYYIRLWLKFYLKKDTADTINSTHDQHKRMERI